MDMGPHTPVAAIDGISGNLGNRFAQVAGRALNGALGYSTMPGWTSGRGACGVCRPPGRLRLTKFCATVRAEPVIWPVTNRLALPAVHSASFVLDPGIRDDCFTGTRVVMPPYALVPLTTRESYEPPSSATIE